MTMRLEPVRCAEVGNPHGCSREADELRRPQQVRRRVAGRSAVVGAVLALCLALPARADDKGKPPANDNFDNLFGAPPAKNALDEMKKAAQGVGKLKADDALAPKVDAVQADGKVNFLGVFAAEKIVEDKKLGCQPAKNKKRVATFTFDELPAKSAVGYDVCLTVQSTTGREVSVRFAVVDPRGGRVNSYTDVMNFAGRTAKLDHVVGFDAPTFKVPGQYVYVVDIDGKEAARLPLFTVVVDGQISGSLGSTPSDLPLKSNNAPTPPSADDPLKAATSREP